MIAPDNSRATHRSEWVVVLLCLAAGALFFASLGTLWPLANTELTRSRDSLLAEARALLDDQGFDLNGLSAASAIVVDTAALDYVESTFGTAAAQDWIRGGLPLVQYRVDLKRRGDRRVFTVLLHPDSGPLGWSRRLEEDDPGRRLSVEQARGLAFQAAIDGLEIDPGDYREFSAASTDRPERRDHTFGLERDVSTDPELRERVLLTVAGDSVIRARRLLVVPSAATNRAVAREAPSRALETVGLGAVAALVLIACWVFLVALRDGQVVLGRSMFWPTVVFVCLMGTYALETPSLFRAWEPLWPRWVSDFRYLNQRAFEGLLLTLLLLVLVAAGDAVDRRGGHRRGAGLWLLARGRFFEIAVARASARGFLVGLLCGGALATAIRLLQLLPDARTSIQPRGFFFYTLNTAAPALTSILFFFGIALAEELGYRFFAGGWIEHRFRKRWLAIGLPALVYGLTHTSLDFLPPAEPWWGRALALSLVGAVWGWAFFRYDALTVVLSHFTADLFIFNWPRLASDDPWIVGVAVLTVCVPLAPAALWLCARPFRDRLPRTG